MRRGAVLIALAVVVAVVPGGGAAATGPERGAPAPASRVPGEVLVRYRTGTEPDERAVARARVRGDLVRRLRVPATELIDVGHGRVDAAVAALESSPDVEFAEPNYIYAPAGRMPNDEFFPLQWSLHSSAPTAPAGNDVDAPEAWEVTTGSKSVVVAVVDTGVAHDHPDLKSNVVGGWDFVGNDPDPYDHEAHGTHVAGTIGAPGNNSTGVSGVAWSVSLMPLRALGPKGGTSADVADAFADAGAKGARVVNASLGGPSSSQAIKKAIAGAPNTLFVVAAGNDGADNDATATYPCNYPAANLICVAATNESDSLASFSNFGATSVDLAAPGTSVLSTVKDHAENHHWYAYMSGTSMATPHVAGAAALLWAEVPDATVGEVRAALLGSVDTPAALAGKVASGGRLNLRRALDFLAGVNLPPTGVSITGFPSPFVKGAAFDVKVSASDPDGIGSFELRHREATYADGFGAPVTQASPDGRFAVGMSAGRTRCFAARATDLHGATSALSAERCTATPVDSKTLTHRGAWAKKSGTGRYLNSFSTTKKKGASLVLRGVKAKRLALVATRCRGCGTVDVLLGTTRLKRVNLAATSTKLKRIIRVADFAAVKSGTVKIVVVSSGKKVIVEGLGASRT